jgi:hypothetical protein
MPYNPADAIRTSHEFEIIKLMQNFIHLNLAQKQYVQEQFDLLASKKHFFKHIPPWTKEERALINSSLKDKKAILHPHKISIFYHKLIMQQEREKKLEHKQHTSFQKKADKCHMLLHIQKQLEARQYSKKLIIYIKVKLQRKLRKFHEEKDKVTLVIIDDNFPTWPAFFGFHPGGQYDLFHLELDTYKFKQLRKFDSKYGDFQTLRDFNFSRTHADSLHSSSCPYFLSNTLPECGSLLCEPSTS